jgi:hypothetical protein
MKSNPYSKETDEISGRRKVSEEDFFDRFED